MLQRRNLLHAALFACAALAGCATTRSELQLPTPAAAPTAAAPATGIVAVIRSVKDERVFEDAPADPSTPSLGFGGATQASAQVRLRAIARKRGGFGQAFGDVLLQEGQTVETVVRDNLGAALRQAGIQVAADAATAPPGAMLLDVRIKAFWSWMNPGFWALTGNGRVITDVAIGGRPGVTTIAAEHKESRQLMTEGAWLEVIGKALEAWRTEATKKLAVPAGAR